MEAEGFRVIDKGIGIGPDDLEKITKKFYRVDNISWNNSMGLGLSIVKEVVERHRGRVAVQSEVGKGSKFSIFFPM